MIYGDNTSAVVMDTCTRVEIDRIEMGSYIWDIAVPDGGGFLLVACEDCSGRVVEMRRKKTVTLKGHTGKVFCIIGCGDTDVLTGSHDTTIRRWNRLTGECIRIYGGHSGYVLALLYDTQSRRIYSGSFDKTIKVWNAETGEQIGVMTGHHHRVFSIAFVNTTTIVSGSADTTLKLWDTTSMREIKTLSSHTNWVNSVAVTPDGQYVVSGSDDKTVKVWNIVTGECVTTLTHNQNLALKVAVSPHGYFMASGDFDSEFHLLSVAPPFPIMVHQGPLADSSKVASVHTLLSDGSLLCSGNILCSLRYDTTCSLDTETRIHLKFNENPRSLSPPSASSAQQWIEAICAMQNNLARPLEKRSNSSRQIISRYRFDLLQVINMNSKRSIPKDLITVIGNYVSK